VLERSAFVKLYKDEDDEKERKIKSSYKFLSSLISVKLQFLIHGKMV